MSRHKHGRGSLPAFEGALIEAARSEEAPQPTCLDNPEAWVDYDTPQMPSAELAERMCEPCPLRELCLENARRTKPIWGVWGGKVWVLGRQADLLDEESLQFRLDTLDGYV